jgi:hypothetical protein
LNITEFQNWIRDLSSEHIWTREDWDRIRAFLNGPLAEDRGLRMEAKYFFWISLYALSNSPYWTYEDLEVFLRVCVDRRDLRGFISRLITNPNLDEKSVLFIREYQEKWGENVVIDYSAEDFLNHPSLSDEGKKILIRDYFHPEETPRVLIGFLRKNKSLDRAYLRIIAEKFYYGDMYSWTWWGTEGAFLKQKNLTPTLALEIFRDLEAHLFERMKWVREWVETGKSVGKANKLNKRLNYRLSRFREFIEKRWPNNKKIQLALLLGSYRHTRVEE